MPNLSCYRLHDPEADRPALDFDDFVETDQPLSVSAVAAFDDFEAKLYVSAGNPHVPPWASFLSEGFQNLNWPTLSSTSAVLIVALLEGGERTRWFAFTFGPAGRFLLRSNAYRRAYGLRVALNVVSGTDVNQRARVRTLDARRRTSEPTRSRVQAVSAAPVSSFGVDQWRDLMTRADGVPWDQDGWGTRISGGDSVSLSYGRSLAEVGALCRRLDEAWSQDNYKREFGWIDHFQPVAEADLRAAVEESIVARFRASDSGGLLLAPPEIVDWDRVSGFHFHFDKPKVFHDPLRIEDLLHGLSSREELAGLTPEFLKARRISMIDGDGHSYYKWPIWNCLVGEVEYQGEVFVLEEGQLFRVAGDYLDTVNTWIDDPEQLPHAAVVFPSGKRGEEEKDYNKRAAAALAECLLLDRHLVSVPGEAPIELSDLLTASGSLVHVKRRGGARELSHLFSQGAVAALALTALPAMRQEGQLRVNSRAEDEGQDPTTYALFDSSPFDPRTLEVVFVLIDDVRGRTRREALPFFSKLNLRRSAQEIQDRGYRVAYCRVEVAD